MGINKHKNLYFSNFSEKTVLFLYLVFVLEKFCGNSNRLYLDCMLCWDTRTHSKCPPCTWQWISSELGSKEEDGDRRWSRSQHKQRFVIQRRLGNFSDIIDINIKQYLNSLNKNFLFSLWNKTSRLFFPLDVGKCFQLCLAIIMLAR